MHQLRIREKRKEQKLRLLDLARTLKVSCPTVHRWEVGTTPPTINDLYRIAEALHVRIEDILPVSPPSPPHTPSPAQAGMAVPHEESVTP